MILDHDPVAHGRAQAIITDMLTVVRHDPEDTDVVWFMRTPLFLELANEDDPVQTLFEMASILCGILTGLCPADGDPAAAWRDLCITMAVEDDDD